MPGYVSSSRHNVAYIEKMERNPLGRRIGWRRGFGEFVDDDAAAKEALKAKRKADPDGEYRLSRKVEFRGGYSSL